MAVREVTGYKLDSPCSNHGEVFELIYLCTHYLFHHHNTETFVDSSSFYLAGVTLHFLNFKESCFFEKFECLCIQSSWDDLQPVHPVSMWHAGAVAYPGILFRGGGRVQRIQLRTEIERGSGGGSPLVRGSVASCNLVQEISFHTVKFS